MREQAYCPIALDPPLRPFRAEDATNCARLNDLAGSGMPLHVWKERARDGMTPWDFGARRQLERLESGQLIVVVDTGTGAEAALMGNTLGPGPEDDADVPDIFLPLIDLENLVLDSWYLNVLATLPQARGKGHGTRLMAVAEDIARAEGRSRISLIASDANTLALPFYAKTGYTEHARRPMQKGDWIGPGDNWLLLVKDI